MPRYLSLFKYSAEGAKGFLKEKAAAREAAAKKAIESVGGKLETFYWVGSGEYTGIAISELPDAASGWRSLRWLVLAAPSRRLVISNC
jgi:uncharacterized protein with GYD domain